MKIDFRVLLGSFWLPMLACLLSLIYYSPQNRRCGKLLQNFWQKNNAWLQA